MENASLPTLACWAALAVLVLGTAGCGEDNGLITISGQVTLDGQPVKEGSVSLMPVSGQGVAGGGEIVNGRYTAQTSPGEMAVQIYAHETVTKDNPTQEEIERGLDTDRIQLLPAVYNRASKLRITVTEEQTTFDFVLTSDGDVPGE